MATPARIRSFFLKVGDDDVGLDLVWALAEVEGFLCLKCSVAMLFLVGVSQGGGGWGSEGGGEGEKKKGKGEKWGKEREREKSCGGNEDERNKNT